MGCHTWVYIPIENQEECKKEIYNENIKSTKEMIELFKSRKEEDIEWLKKEYESDKRNYDFYLKHPKYCSKEVLENLKKELGKSFNDWKNHFIKEYENLLTNEEYNLRPHDSKYSYYNGRYYQFIDEYGDNLGRIHEYDTPNITTKREFIERFEKYGCEYNSRLLDELFDKYTDVLIHFG